MSSDKEHPAQKPILISACLLGLPTRYDGKSKRSQKVLDYLKSNNFSPVPVCPEQLAGMSTPRDKTFFKTGDGHDVLSGSGLVISQDGQEMNEIFCRGARMVLQIAQLSKCQKAMFKERSPSCGVHQIYQGENKVKGTGVTTALLLREGFQVISEEDI